MLMKRAHMAQPWLLLVYRVPSEPASKRVAIWRDLKRLGALYLQQCVCLVPHTEALAAAFDRVHSKIVDDGGEALCMEISQLRPADETKIIDAFRALRDKEYDELIEECATKFVKEIEFERFRHNYTFEEAEEIEHDLDKIRRWFTRIVERDWFAAPRRAQAEAWIDQCQVLLDAFEHDVYERDSQESASQGTPHAVHDDPPAVDVPQDLPCTLTSSPRSTAPDDGGT
jgi:hypothetical protein